DHGPTRPRPPPRSGLPVAVRAPRRRGGHRTGWSAGGRPPPPRPDDLPPGRASAAAPAAAGRGRGEPTAREGPSRGAVDFRLGQRRRPGSGRSDSRPGALGGPTGLRDRAAVVAAAHAAPVGGAAAGGRSVAPGPGAPAGRDRTGLARAAGRTGRERRLAAHPAPS